MAFDNSVYFNMSNDSPCRDLCTKEPFDLDIILKVTEDQQKCSNIIQGDKTFEMTACDQISVEIV